MDDYQERFQTCSFTWIDTGVIDLPTCLREGHIFYMETDEELAADKDVKDFPGECNMDTTTSKVPVMGLNANKAGMTGVNVEQINKKIMQISEGSKFHEHKKKQQEKIDKKVEEMKRKLASHSLQQIERAQIEVDNLVRTIEADMDLSRYYVHLDMDAFFAAVEMRDDPSLRNVPMAVGSDSMLSTSNYVARTYGVRAAMPGFIARKLCPDLKIVPCNFQKYQEASKMVEEILKPYDVNLFMCMDEADLDITDHVTTRVGNGSRPEDKQLRDNVAYNIVDEIRKKIQAGTQLTASAGIAPTRFLAKLCSDIRKPNGQLMLANRKPSIMAFLSMIPVRKVCGIGAVTEQLLKGLEIENCRKLWQQRAILSLLFKRASFQNLLGISIGTGSSVFRDLSSGDDSSNRKSLSCERTFIGTSDLGFLENLCKSLCVEIERDLKAARLCARTITLKIKTTEYDVKTRARSIMESTDLASRIFEAAWKIYLSYVAEIPDLTIRLMGVRVSTFQNAAVVKQPTINHRMMAHFKRNEQEQQTCKNPIDLQSEDENTGCISSCPVCGKQIKSSCQRNLELLMDLHIDSCLSRDKVREVRTQFATLSPPKKRTANHVTGNETKKVKQALDGIPKIDYYFRKV